MKKTLKAVLAALLVVCLLLPLAACGNNATTETKLKIAIPNDTTNEARALLLLQDQGYIKLKDGAGITAGFEYKGFDFSMLWAGSGKVSRFISAGLRVPFGGGNYGLLQYMIDDHWTPETAETAKTPRFSGAANANNYTRNSTLWLKDASYIRLKNVQIGYTFKGEWMKKIHLKNMRIYASGENLLTFDHLKIADPEATDDKQFQYPLQMIFNIGLNLNF